MTSRKGQNPQSSPVIKKQFESLVRAASDAILGVDHQGKITIWNKAATKMFGHTAKQAIGMDLHDLLVPERILAKTKRGFKDFVKTGKGPLIGKTTECIALRKDGSEFPVELSISGFRQDDLWHAVGIVRDISKHKHAEAAFQVLLEGAVSQIGEEFFENIVYSMATWLHADCVILGEIDGHKIKANTMVLDGQAVDEFSYTLAGAPCENVVDKGFCAFQESVRKKFPEDRDLITLGAEGYAGVPLKDRQGHVIGVLCAIFRSKARFPPRMEEVFEIIADRAAAEMERSQVEKALEEEKNESRQIIETARDAFVSMDADGIITDWNPQAEEIFGWSRKEALGRNLAETIIPEEYREAHTKGLKHYLATGEGPVLNQHIEITAQHRDSHTFPVELSIVSVHTNGDVNFNAFIRDISARHEAHEALEKSREQLRTSLIGTVVAVSRAVGARDPYTAGHQQRVSKLSRAIAQEMGVDAERVDGLRMGASIHDIGKIYLPAEILSKPTKLSDIEYKLIQSHSQVGYDILKDITFPWPVADIAWQHHERLDGSGYPQGLKGDKICLEARIVAVADVVEAMASHRPYRAALGIDAALEEIKAHRGTWFDPDAVDACFTLIREKGFCFDNPD